MKTLLYALCLLVALPLQAQPLNTATPGAGPVAGDIDLSGISRESYDNPLVLIETTRGNLVLELFPREAPETVANFLALAEGGKAHLDPVSREWVTRRFYDGLHIHRVVRDYFIQAGSPVNDASGGPGYTLPDEISARSLGLDRMKVLGEDGRPHPWLGIRDQADFQARVLRPLYQSMGIGDSGALRARLAQVDQRLRAMSLKDLYELQGYRFKDDLISRPPVRGVIAMANSGPGGNGSQFFIALSDLPWLTGRHTVFGKLRGGLDALDAIGQVATDGRDRPLDPVVILSLRRID